MPVQCKEAGQRGELAVQHPLLQEFAEADDNRPVLVGRQSPWRDRHKKSGLEPHR